MIVILSYKRVQQVQGMRVKFIQIACYSLPDALNRTYYLLVIR